MADDPGHVMLSAEERRSLAALEADLRRDDPALDAALCRFRPPGRRAAARQAALAVALVLAGGVAMSLVWLLWPPAAAAPAVAEGAGLWLLLRPGPGRGGDRRAGGGRGESRRPGGGLPL